MAFAAAEPPFATPDATRPPPLARLFPGTRFRFRRHTATRLLSVGGNAVLGALSVYIIYEAVRLGLPRHKLVRMLANIPLEVLSFSASAQADLFDRALKANLRNLAIIDDHLRGSVRRS
jgi:hypothetical protein